MGCCEGQLGLVEVEGGWGIAEEVQGGRLLAVGQTLGWWVPGPGVGGMAGQGLRWVFGGFGRVRRGAAKPSRGDLCHGAPAMQVPSRLASRSQGASRCAVQHFL